VLSFAIISQFAFTYKHFFFFFLFSCTRQLRPAAQALVEFGDTLKQMADVKYALDDNVKQNFLEPLHQLQMKDLKEVMVSCCMSSTFSINFPFFRSASSQKTARSSFGL